MKERLEVARAWIRRLLGPIILLYLLATTEPARVIATVQRADIRYLLAGLVMTWVVVTVQCLRWQVINKQQRIVLCFREAFSLYAMAFAVGAVTPGKVGEFIKVHYVGKLGYASSKAFASVVVDRLSDILWIVAVGYPVLVFSLENPRGLATGTSLGLFFLLMLGGGIGIVRHRARAFLGGRCSRLLASRKVCQAMHWLRQAWTSVVTMRRRVLLPIACLTGLAWLTQYFQAFLFVKALTLPFGFFEVLIFVAIVRLVTLVPISIAGVGSRDLTLVFLFKQVGHSEVEALAFSACLLLAVVVYVLASGVVFHPRWRRELLRTPEVP
jgi:hypothetical protein